VHWSPLIEISFIGIGAEQSLQVAAQDGANISLHGEAKYFKQETAALLLPLLLLLSFYNKRHCFRLGCLATVINGYTPIEWFPPGGSVSHGGSLPCRP
jgi:hypothetical protein